MFGEEFWLFAVELLEGHVEGGHDSCALFGVCHLVVPAVVELEVDHLVRFGGAVVA